MPLCSSGRVQGTFKLKVCLEDGQYTDITVSDGTKCLKDLIDEDLQNEWPEINFKNLQLYGAGKRLADDMKIPLLPSEIMALSCPDPPQWSIPGPGAHLPLQPYRNYTITRHVLCTIPGVERGRILSPGCIVCVEETSSDSIRIKTLRFEKRNFEGVIVLPEKPILGLPDMPLSLREGYIFAMEFSIELLDTSAARRNHLMLQPNDIVRVSLDSDFIHRLFPEDALLIVTRDANEEVYTGTIRLVRKNKCSIRPITTLADVMISQWHFHCSRALNTFDDFNWIVDHDRLVIAASHSNRGTSVLTEGGKLVLLDKKEGLLNVKQAFALRVMLSARFHPKVYEKCLFASLSAEMTSLRARWLCAIKNSLGMVQTKENINIFMEFAPAVSRSLPISKVATRVNMSNLSVVAALL
eukprot:GEMP01023167.1.p1 GENE.GEMP01023167.1~~GEMP01023167.1.p1  ORF type:complete len:411 (+),score=61.69 GEMP01023167.1:212-1444(+)